ncbi:unnamed protein product [marine sediment metagenome]|uniref:Uncharacterized protein n=1 Tax=marine sediment metagenome TaxID=412755 RepID=X1A5N5_9ZZZZ
MFKKIFKAAKNLARSPVGQIGIGLLAPSLFPGVSPALLQGGIGLLGGSKPEDVLRNVAFGAASAGAYGGKEGIGRFFTGQQPTPQVISNAAATRGREGVVEAEAQRGFQDQLGRGLAGLLSSGYGQAQQQAQKTFEDQKKSATRSCFGTISGRRRKSRHRSNVWTVWCECTSSHWRFGFNLK